MIRDPYLLQEQMPRTARLKRPIGRRRFACYHEAGHCLARWFLGFHSWKATVLTVEQVRDGVLVVDSYGRKHLCEGYVEAYDIRIHRQSTREDLLPEARCRAEMTLIEMLSGVVAEAAYRRRSILAVCFSGGSGDVATARTVQAEWLADRDGALDIGFKRATALVRSSRGWEALRLIAEQLYRDGEIEEDRIASICGGVYGLRPAYAAWLSVWPPTLDQIRQGAFPAVLP